MKSLKVLATAILGATAVSANAQNAGDLLRFSQNNHAFGTARSAAMGGAFSSLGADLSTMHINPAGLGMYRSSEIGITPGITWNTIESEFGGIKNSDSRPQAIVGNVGVAFNLYQGTGKLTSFTLGFSYSPTADFHANSFAGKTGSDISMLDYFAPKLRGFDENTLGQFPRPFEITTVDMWGAILGYQTNMLEHAGNNQYINVLYAGDLVDPSLRLTLRGRQDEYVFSGGFNFRNKIYLGASLGIQDVFHRNRSTYREMVTTTETRHLNSFDYIRTFETEGTGINGKFGITLRPISPLRIGLAVHTPTVLYLREEYIERMISAFDNAGLNRDFESVLLVNNYNIITPTKLLAGVSYTFPFGIISTDYERVWYNGMRIRNSDQGDEFESVINSDIRNSYKPANNFRAGLEVIPASNFYLRAGYAYYGNCMKHDDLIALGRPDIKSYQNYSGGIGYSFDNISLDLAYINTHYKYTPYETFPPVTMSDGEVKKAGLISTKQQRHTIAVSLNMAF